MSTTADITIMMVSEEASTTLNLAAFFDSNGHAKSVPVQIGHLVGQAEVREWHSRRARIDLRLETGPLNSLERPQESS